MKIYQPLRLTGDRTGGGVLLLGERRRRLSLERSRLSGGVRRLRDRSLKGGGESSRDGGGDSGK